jgi:hypothetical protein
MYRYLQLVAIVLFALAVAMAVGGEPWGPH